ncbi:MAG TPA: MotA/TolQ/ExbB proton channel family protein [Gemmatimonadota bacterium]|nr:MotA/TolQ/ExbB proton channel family protein [Gemmatimonadota bacterium]
MSGLVAAPLVAGLLQAAQDTALAAGGAAGAASGAGRQALATSPWQMALQATTPTQVILIVLAVFSVWSWVLIFWKWSELRRVAREGDEFVMGMERASGLEEVRRVLLHLDESPYTRVFREGLQFFRDLSSPGPADEKGTRREITPARLDTLWMVLEKELSEERDDLAHGLPWLAIIGSVSPLLGLLGTVVGVMNSFIGISARGSANIAAVAPGIAEALITTVVGLFVAIPAVIAYNHYAAKLGLFASELEGFASEFVGTLAREGHV